MRYVNTAGEIGGLELLNPEMWNLNVHGPDHFSWSRILWAANGDHRPEFIQVVLEKILALDP